MKSLFSSSNANKRVHFKSLCTSPCEYSSWNVMPACVNFFSVKKVKTVSGRKSRYSVEENPSADHLAKKHTFVVFFYSDVDPEKHMICEPCDSKLLGGFDHDKKEV